MKVTRRKAKPVRIEMLPLIDIVFLLLVFFIYAMLSMAVHRGLHLDLPESSQVVQEEDSPLNISVRKGVSGVQVFVNETQVLLEKLAGYLTQSQQGVKEPKPALIFAEEDISYQQLFKVLDQVKKSGIQSISLQANKE